ncbi:MAG: condensation domain-containing protein [Streptosporangiaceae bacterium]
MMDRHRSGYGALNCPLLCRIQGPLDDDALATVIDELGHRHESLRTTFAGRGRNLVQIIHDPGNRELRRSDLSGSADAHAAVRQAITAELASRIDPACWPVRATLWRVAPAEHVLCFNMHHLVTDAWSTGILFQELLLSLGQRAGEHRTLPEPGWQYRQFAEHQRHLFDSDGMRRHRDYWRRQLAGAQLPALRTDTGQAGSNSASTKVESTEIGAPVVQALKNLASREGATLFSVMLAVNYVLLHGLTGQDDLAVGSLFANRSRPELRRTVGFLANMVVLRTRLGRSETFSDLLRATHRTVIGAFAYQELPYQMLPADTIRTDSQRPDDVVFQLVGDPGYRAKIAEFEIEMLVPEAIGGRFNLELTIVPHGDTFSALLFYNQAWIDAHRASQIVSGYARLATAVAASPDSRLTDLYGRVC